MTREKCKKRLRTTTSKSSRKRKIFSLQSGQALKISYCLRGNSHSIVKTNLRSSITARMNQFGEEFKIDSKELWKWSSKSSNTCKNYNRLSLFKMISVNSISKSLVKLAHREVFQKLDLIRTFPSPNPWWIVSSAMRQV